MNTSSPTLRVLVVFEFGALNGGENSYLSLLQPLANLGVEVSAVAPPDSALSQTLELAGVPQRALSIARDRPPDDDAFVAVLRQAASAFGVDLIHSNSLSMSRRAGRIRSRLNITCLGHLRDIIGLSRKAVQDLNRNQQLVAVSQAAKDFHVAQGLAPERCSVIHNGVDLDRFRPADNRHLPPDLDLPEDAFVLTSIGQIGMRKGWDSLLRAFQRVVRQAPQAHLLAVGERNSQKQEAIDYEFGLRTFANQEGLAERVHFLGRRDDIPQLLAASDLLIHAARQEPLGRVLLEAASTGLPIVATDVGGTREILSNEKHALLCSVDDEQAMADAVLRLIGQPEMRRSLGANARWRVESHFTNTQAAAALANQYRRLIHEAS